MLTRWLHPICLPVIFLKNILQQICVVGEKMDSMDKQVQRTEAALEQISLVPQVQTKGEMDQQTQRVKVKETLLVNIFINIFSE